MIRASVTLALLAIVAVAALSQLPSGDPGVTAADPIPTQVYPTDGSVRPHRMPWLDGNQQTFNQGWEGVYSHDGQYATDWGPEFEIYSASEGDTTCIESQTGWGTFIDVLRSDGKTERYAHIERDCPPTLPAHVEQGTAMATASRTGCGTCGIHLHYEVFYITTSVRSALSNFADLSDTEYHPWSHYVPHPHNPFRSDNAGPGVGADPWTGGAFWLAYTGLGHAWCAGKAYNCFGSSLNSVGEGRKAVAGCLPSWPECGWMQDFKEMASTGGENHGFGKPNGCASAYWGPDGFYWAWVFNGNNLGYPRTNIYYVPPGHPAPRGSGYYQAFRYGYLYSSGTTSATPYYDMQTTGCG